MFKLNIEYFGGNYSLEPKEKIKELLFLKEMVSKVVRNRRDITAIFISLFALCCPVALGKSELHFQSFIQIANVNMTYTVKRTLQTRSKIDCGNLCTSDPSCLGFTRQNKTCTLLAFDEHSHDVHHINGDEIFIWLKKESTSNYQTGETTVPAIQTTTHELTTTQPMVEEITCPNEFTSFPEGCFHLSQDPADWDSAKSECQDLHQSSHLITLDTNEVGKLFPFTHVGF